MAATAPAKVALGLQKYIKPTPRPYNRKISEQLNEYYGLSGFHCKEHETLSLSLKSISSSYQTSSLEDRKRLATEEISHWNTYITSRVASLPDSFKTSPITEARIQRIWSQILHRGEEGIECSRILDFHCKFIEHYPFDVPLDKRVIYEMVHPHAGYLSLMPGAFTLINLMDFYRVGILAAYERSLGEDLLSKGLSTYNFYRFIQGQNAWLDLRKINEMLVTFKFSPVRNMEEFVNEFKWTLQDFPKEFDGMNEENFFLRFAVVRKIFLDYNL